MCVAQIHVNAQLAEALGGIVNGDLRAHPAQPPHDSRKVCWLNRRADPECPCFAHSISRAGRTDQRLGWDTAKIQAVAAHELAFNQGHAGAETCRACCRHQPGCTCSDDYKIVAARGVRVDPIRRMRVGHQGLVKFIRGTNLKRGRLAHCKLPPQLDPAPAVQPKQWPPVAMAAFARPENESISQIVFPPGVSRSSIWLKSQS